MRFTGESASRIKTRNSIQRRSSFEALEDRSMLSGAGFTVSTYDPGNLLAAYPSVIPTIEAAGQILNGLISIQKPISVEVVPTSSYSGSDSGASATGAPYLDGSMTKAGAYEVVTPGALYDALGRVPPYGVTGSADIGITLNLSLISGDWFDPTGAARSDPVPSAQADFLSTALHELLHGLGFDYLRQEPTTSVPVGQTQPVAVPGQIDAFAEDTAFDAGSSVLYFTGPTAEAHFGGPVPLYSVPASDPRSISNYSHIGGAAGYPGAGLEDLMNADATAGTRYNVSDLDLAILADIGYNVLNYPGLPPAVSYGPSFGFGASTGSSLLAVTTTGSPKGTIDAVLHFSGDLDPVAADDLSSYSLTFPGKPGPHHTRKPGKPVPISTVFYDPATNEVTLKLVKPLARGQTAQLVIHGLIDISGQPVGGELSATVRGVVVKKHGK